MRRNADQTFKYFRSVATEAIAETKSPTPKSPPEATQTSDHLKNLVNESKGATFASTNPLNPANNPADTAHPKIAEIRPSKRKGSWMEKEEAPTSFITPVSRRLLNAARRRVLLIRRAAVKTLTIPIKRAPSRSTPSN